jgi:hypothetical protein
MATPAGASVTKLTEHKYAKWAPEIRNLLGLQGVWRLVAAYNGLLPRPPLTPAIQPGGQCTLPKTSDWFDLEPQSGDPQYLTEFDRFAEKRDKQKDLLIKASSTIRSALDPAIGLQYEDDKYLYNPSQLWTDIKAQYQRQVRREGAHLLTVLDNCQLTDYPSITEWLSAQDKIIGDLSICGIKIQGEHRCHYITKNLPKGADWGPFLTALEISNDSSEKSQSIADLRKNLLTYEACLRREKGIEPGAALYVTRKNRKQPSAGQVKGGESGSKKPVVCYGCGKKGHRVIVDIQRSGRISTI